MELNKLGLSVRWLGHASFEVKVKNFVIHIDPYSEVYEKKADVILISHAHLDHFDPVIFEWQDQIDKITYIFGWQAGNNPEHHYLIGPRGQMQTDGMEIYTINSYHSDVPEVAYLVIVEGVVIYHNGDYLSAFVEDLQYLQTFTNHIDIAFMIGWPFVDHQHFQQTLHLADTFDPTHIFAISREGDEEKSRLFAELLVEHGVKADILYAEQRGDYFVCTRRAMD